MLTLSATSRWSVWPALRLIGFDSAHQTIELFLISRSRARLAIGQFRSALDQESKHPIGLVPREWSVRHNSRHRNQYLSYPAKNELVHEKGRRVARGQV